MGKDSCFPRYQSFDQRLVLFHTSLTRCLSTQGYAFLLVCPRPFLNSRICEYSCLYREFDSAHKHKPWVGFIRYDEFNHEVCLLCPVRMVSLYARTQRCSHSREAELPFQLRSTTTCRYVQQVCCIGQPAIFFFLNPCF